MEEDDFNCAFKWQARGLATKATHTNRVGQLFVGGSLSGAGYPVRVAAERPTHVGRQVRQHSAEFTWHRGGIKRMGTPPAEKSEESQKSP